METKTINQLDYSTLSAEIDKLFKPEAIDIKHTRIRDYGRRIQEEVALVQTENKTPFQMNILGLLEIIGRVFGFAPAIEKYPITADIQNTDAVRNNVRNAVEAIDRNRTSRFHDVRYHFTNAYSELSHDEQKRYLSATIDQTPSEQKKDMYALMTGNLDYLKTSHHTQSIAEKQAKTQEMLDKIQKAANEIEVKDKTINELNKAVYELNSRAESLQDAYDRSSKVYNRSGVHIYRGLSTMVKQDIELFERLVSKGHINLGVLESHGLNKLKKFKEQIDATPGDNSLEIGSYLSLRSQFISSLDIFDTRENSRGRKFDLNLNNLG